MPTETNDETDRPPFRESADAVLAMWKAGEYTSLLAEAVQDCRALLYAVPAEHDAYKPLLEAILQEATALLAQQGLAAVAPALAGVSRTRAPLRKSIRPFAPTKEPEPAAHKGVATEGRKRKKPGRAAATGLKAAPSPSRRTPKKVGAKKAESAKARTAKKAESAKARTAKKAKSAKARTAKKAKKGAKKAPVRVTNAVRKGEKKRKRPAQRARAKPARR